MLDSRLINEIVSLARPHRLKEEKHTFRRGFRGEVLPRYRVAQLCPQPKMVQVCLPELSLTSFLSLIYFHHPDSQPQKPAYPRDAIWPHCIRGFFWGPPSGQDAIL